MTPGHREDKGPDSTSHSSSPQWGTPPFPIPTSPGGADRLPPERLLNLPRQIQLRPLKSRHTQRTPRRPRAWSGLGMLASPSTSHTGTQAVRPPPISPLCLLPGQAAKPTLFLSPSLPKSLLFSAEPHFLSVKPPFTEHFKVPGRYEAWIPPSPGSHHAADVVTPFPR